MRYISLSTQIEKMISYKYSIVICNWGHHYYAIKLWFWCSHLECSDSCLNVSYFCGCMFMELWLSQKFIALFLVVRSINSGVFYSFTNSPNDLAREEIIELCLHKFLSCMSILFMALWFDEEWKILQFLKSHRRLHQWNQGSTAPSFIGYPPISSKG